jgi:hypothetical protein
MRWPADSPELHAAICKRSRRFILLHVLLTPCRAVTTSFQKRRYTRRRPKNKIPRYVEENYPDGCGCSVHRSSVVVGSGWRYEQHARRRARWCCRCSAGCTGAIIGGALGGGAGTAAGNAMGGRGGGLVGAALGGGAGSALGGNISRSNSYADDYSRGYRSGKRHHKHRRYD